MRDAAYDILVEAVDRFGSVNMHTALDLFDDVLEGEGLAVEARVPNGLFTKDEISAIARYQAGKLRVDDREGFLNQIGDAAANLTRQAGNRTMFWQGGNFGHSAKPSKEFKYFLYGSGRGRVYDEYQVRYARVPQGFETCDFCLLLASRGFVYLTAESAEMGHVHRNCDCIVVPGVGHWERASSMTNMDEWIQDTSLEGYDTSLMSELHGEWAAISAQYPNLRSDDDDYYIVENEKLDAMERIIGRREW